MQKFNEAIEFLLRYEKKGNLQKNKKKELKKKWN